MQQVASPTRGQSSNQPLVWQAFIQGAYTYYGEKGCCYDWYQHIYLYSWREVNGRFCSKSPAWNPRMMYEGTDPDPPYGHEPGACYIERPGQWNTVHVAQTTTGIFAYEGMLAVNTAEFYHSNLIRKQVPSPVAGTGGCSLVLMSIGWFDDLEKCSEEPRMPRLRAFFHQPVGFGYTVCQ